MSELQDDSGSRGKPKQNTPLVGDGGQVHIYYRYHSHAGCELEVAKAWRARGHQINVMLPNGSRLLVPEWMAQPSAAAFEVNQAAAIRIEALLTICQLIESCVCQPAAGQRSTLSEEETDSGKGDTDGAASTPRARRGSDRSSRARRKPSRRAGDPDGRRHRSRPPARNGGRR